MGKGNSETDARKWLQVRSACPRTAPHLTPHLTFTPPPPHLLHIGADLVGGVEKGESGRHPRPLLEDQSVADDLQRTRVRAQPDTELSAVLRRLKSDLQRTRVRAQPDTELNAVPSVA